MTFTILGTDLRKIIIKATHRSVSSFDNVEVSEIEAIWMNGRQRGSDRRGSILKKNILEWLNLLEFTWKRSFCVI